MTAVVPGLNPRDSQILQLLRGGAPVKRVIEIGRHRGTWNEVHVGTIVAFHLNAEPVKRTRTLSAPKPVKQRPVAQCGTYSGYQRHIRAKEKPCPPCRDARNAYADAKKSETAAKGMETEAWTPEPFTGRATTVVLTSGQLNVLEQLCRGLSNGRIAIALNLSEDTVKSHVKDILAALGAVDRTHAVVRVLTRQVTVQVRRTYQQRKAS